MKTNKTIDFTNALTKQVLQIPVIDKIPRGYSVWNIGRNAPSGYILVCVVRNYNILPETLKALKLSNEEIKLIDKAAAWGSCDLASCLKSLKLKGLNYNSIRRRETAAAALPIFRRITEPTNTTDDAQGAALQEARA